MKVAGALTLVAAFVVALLFALVPTSVTFFGTTGSCGPPVLRVFVHQAEASLTDDFGVEQSVVDECVGQSWMRLVIGAAVGGVLGIGGALMLAFAPQGPGPVAHQAWLAPPGYGWPPQQPYPQAKPPTSSPAQSPITPPSSGGHPSVQRPPLGPPRS